LATYENSTILVTGAGGHLGRKVIDNLLARGATKIIAVTRDPSKLADLAAKGVDVRAGDFNDPASLDAAFQGADRVLVISTDAIGIPGGRKAQHIRAIDAAERAGATHIAYTSITSPYPSNDPACSVPDDHFWTEARLIGGKTDWSLLRNNIYAEIALHSAGPAVASGKLFHAQGKAGRASVAHDDAAAAAAGALLTAEGKHVFDVSGPEAVPATEFAAILSQISGKPVEAVALTGAQLIEGLKAAGMPETVAPVMAQFDVDTSTGSHSIVTDAVEVLTGNKPRSFRDVLVANRAAFAS